MDGWGSSPLARGLPDFTPDASAVSWIIPARAGFTGGTGTTGVAWRDHPRSRGVYEAKAIAYHRDAGSSPLARGLLVGASTAHPFLRIIPARAGFTGSPPRLPVRTADHPRSRGVYAVVLDRAGRDEGSSPLARGLPFAGA